MGKTRFGFNRTTFGENFEIQSIIMSFSYKEILIELVTNIGHTLNFALIRTY